MTHQINTVVYSRKIEFPSSALKQAIRYCIHIQFKNVGQKIWFPADLRNQILILRKGDAYISTNDQIKKQPPVCIRGSFDKPVEVHFGGEMIDVIAVEFFPGMVYPITGKKASTFTNSFTELANDEISSISEIKDTEKLIFELKGWLQRRMHESNITSVGFRKAERIARQNAGLMEVKELADQVGMHPRTLRRYFHDYTGLSPRAYLLQLRFEDTVRRAISENNVKRLYLSGSASFYDQAHFINCFKRFSGVTPSKIKNLDRSWLEFILNIES